MFPINRIKEIALYRHGQFVQKAVLYNLNNIRLEKTTGTL